MEQNQEYCKDCYNLKLEVGQSVIPIWGDALLANIEGVISKIEYSEFYNVWFIDISDDRGNVLLKGVNPRNYSTQERFDERENQEYVYSLCFYDDYNSYITHISLTKTTNPNYEFPEGVAYVNLEEKISEQIADTCQRVVTEHLGLFMINQQAVIKKYSGNSSKYLVAKNSPIPIAVRDNCCIKKFNSIEKLNAYLKNLISLFNKKEDITIESINIKYNTETNEHENIHEIRQLNPKHPNQNKNKYIKKMEQKKEYLKKKNSH